MLFIQIVYTISMLSIALLSCHIAIGVITTLLVDLNEF